MLCADISASISIELVQVSLAWRTSSEHKDTHTHSAASVSSTSALHPHNQTYSQLFHFVLLYISQWSTSPTGEEHMFTSSPSGSAVAQGDNVNESMSLVWQDQSGRGIFHTHRCCHCLSGLLIIILAAVRTLPTLKPQLLFSMLFAVVKLKAQERKKDKKYVMFIHDAATCVFRSIIH